MQSKSAILVLSYVMRVLRSVKNISVWNIVNYVHKHVEDVQKNVVRWLAKQKIKKVGYDQHINSFSFPYFAVFVLSVYSRDTIIIDYL
jgi:hypothetical protein